MSNAEAAVAQVMLDLPEDLAMPEGLSERAAQAWNVIVQFLAENGLTHTGGRKAFVNPSEWTGYSEESLLLVFHEGSDVGQAFSLDYCYERRGSGASCYAKLEAMAEKLRRIGLFTELASRCYSAVYEIR